ncbi:MAG: polyphosphate kinase 2 [Nitratireductor sp.]
MKHLETSPIELTINRKKRVFDLKDPELPDWVKECALGCEGYPYEKKLKWSKYEDELFALHEELVKAQYWLEESGARVISIFEGRDSAGKGGTIKALRENLSPRRVKTVALSKPTDVESGQWYFQRYISHFPTKGEMVLFDRSWYNRAGVEPVMGFCSDKQHKKFLTDVPAFEEMIVNEGIYFFKFWLTIGQEMQLKRFHDRRHNPVKIWKLSPIDVKALSKWNEYGKARDLMFKKTHTPKAPWTVIKANDKRRARLNVIRRILHTLPYTGKDKKKLGAIDKKIVIAP